MTPSQCAYQAVQARHTLPHGQRPTDLHIRVMFVLARWQHASPPHGKLARAAHCHRNSVLNALHRLRELGLLTWERQFTRIGGGWRLQTANRYLFVSNPLPPARAEAAKKGKNLSSFLGRQSLCSGVATEVRQAALETLGAVAQRRQLTLGLGKGG